MRKVSPNTFPFYDTKKKEWKVRINGRTERGDLLYVASEFAYNGLYYPFHYREEPENWQDHEHSFEGVIYNLFQHPETFSIKGFENYYSQQEIELLDSILKRTLELKNDLPQ